MEKLVEYATQDLTNHDECTYRHVQRKLELLAKSNLDLRYSYISAEILSSELAEISDALLVGPTLLATIWSIIELPPKLDVPRSTNFCKIVSGLLDRKPEEVP